MKLLLTSKNTADARQRLKLLEVENFLDVHPRIDQRSFLKKLAQALLFPDSYFISLPAQLVAELIVEFFAFLESKPEAITIHSLPSNSHVNRLLLIGTPNAPYFVDSLRVLRSKRQDEFAILAHPLLTINRQGNTITYLGSDMQSGGNELFMLLRLDYLNTDTLAALENEVHDVLCAAWQAFRDYPRLTAKLDALKAADNLTEWQAFIDWLKQDAFIPIAYLRNPQFTKTHSSVENPSDLGMDIRFCGSDAAANLAVQFERLSQRDTDVIVEALPIDSPIISHEALLYIGFRERNQETNVEHAFLGIFNRLEAGIAVQNIPALREKIAATLSAAKVSGLSHDYLKMQELFALFPKVELFFLHDTQLLLLAQSLLRYLFRPDALKLLFLASPSPFHISTLIIIPRQLYRHNLELRLQEKLCAELSAQLIFARKIDTGSDYLGLSLNLMPADDESLIDVDVLEKQLNRLAKSWDLRFRILLEREFGKQLGGRLWRKYRSAFSADYQSLMPPRYAIKDLLQIEQILQNDSLRIELLTPCQNNRNYRLQFYSYREYFLDECIPVLANLNLRLIDQMQFYITVDGVKLYLKSFEIKPASSHAEPLHRLRTRILDTVQAIFYNRVDNDALNGLLVLAGMTWKEIDVLRGYRNYFLQLGFQSARASFHRALTHNPQVAKCLFDYFEARFRPDSAWDDALDREEQLLLPIRLQLLAYMENVADINDDRILRTLFNLIDATVRSNFHRHRGEQDYFLAFKINSLGIIEMPAPRPEFEIYVHAADMQGIHMRSGKIARGGIRWSDRPDDFRTEILGLMQTQISKNALIVPTGAKGGFVVKRIAEGESIKDAGKKAYKCLIRGLLDLTDNYLEDQVAAPPEIVTYDDDDPYLVVAADKGTAQFSDLANAISAEYRFWLHEAFASGGSQGYNHKALGITARGAWECVKRHFRELGKDIQSEPFTAIGIGSMDGDVFGNGMLLSPSLRLLAAFSGQHIFIDPHPDPERSFGERKRLFELPGSTWDDYDRGLISKGGGVYRRDAKDITISPEVKKWLGIRYRMLDGESLIRYLLMVRVDLLWLGGIGTYIKASFEKHEEVGDRSNDNVRVNANTLQAQVIGEGANLGFTQKARIEYARAGGRINTDAVDNSAGVDTSDHEVNLKILLFALRKNQQLGDYQALFTGLTDAVCQAVLFNNYAQSLCLSLDQRRNAEHPELFIQLAERLQSAGLLDFNVESFPPAKEILARPGATLSRPELAVLMSACKRLLKQQLLDQQAFITDPCCERYLQEYFPQQIVRQYHQQLPSHPLANAVKATVISNRIVNQGGCAFLGLALQSGNNTLIDAVSTYLTYDSIVAGDTLRQSIYALDNKVNTDIQYRLLLQFENALADICRWHLLHDITLHPDASTITRYRGYLQEYQTTSRTPAEQQPAPKTAQEISDDVPPEITQRLTDIATLQNFPLLVKLAEASGQALGKILAQFNEMAAYLGLQPVQQHLAQIPLHDQWDRKVLADIREQLNTTAGRLVLDKLQSDAKNCAEYFNSAERVQKYNRYKYIYQELAATLPVTLLPYTLLSKELENLLKQ